MGGMDLGTQREKTVAAKVTLINSEAVGNSLDTKLKSLLQAQQQAFLRDPSPSREERVARLKKLKTALLDNKKALLDAVYDDFGGRARNETLLAEFMPALEGIKYSIRNLRKWMQPSRRHVGFQLQPASAKVVYQPLGVVGIVVPWNYPLQLGIVPVITALAAGNRAMVKMSEFTPKTSALFAQVIKQTFPEDLVTVVTGEADVAAAFTTLPFDHLLFTGSTHVGKHVMAAAAQNLTPVTLELGGKSPAIVDGDFPIEESAQRICFGKSINSGQTCIAPDYLLIRTEDVEAFVQAYCKAFNEMYPTINGNDDYTGVINQRQYQRLQAHIDDARARGADIRPVSEEVVNDGSRRMVPHLILSPTDEMTVMQEEIFGPLLPVIAVDGLDQAIDYVRSKPRPLALYYFGSDKSSQQKVISQTHSGGVAINDTVMHVAVDDLPFGGIGPSGMGHYHGHEGFLTFSKAKSVLTKGRINSAKMVYPPHNSFFKKCLVKFLS